jgi:molybdopterin-guanine dinucleotide biosynthesis protein A
MYGLVLAGGQSSRLGQDKTAVLHEGRTLLVRSAELLQQHVRDVYISCRHPERAPETWPVIVDETERVGPAGGIITALRQLGGPALVLACDLPFMDDEHIVRLLEARESRPPGSVLTAWRLENSEFFENLVAIYEQEALPLLEQGVRRGIYKLGRLIPPEARHYVTYTEAERRIFFNVNYPDDLNLLHGE